jgi:hypothetical protein
MAKGDRDKDLHIKLHDPAAEGLLAIVVATLEELGFHPQKIAGVDGYVVDFEDELLEGALAQLISVEGRFVFYIDFKEKASEATRPSVAEFITRANYGVIIGNFELDYQDGTVRFKTSVDFEGLPLAPALIRNVVRAGHQGVTVYGQELANVMRKSKAPAQAVVDADSAANL